MKQRIILSAGFILTALWLTACSLYGADPGKQSGQLVYGVGCVILRGHDETYYIIEKPEANNDQDWEGTDPSLRHQWTGVEYGEVAGRILADVLNENEFLDARVSVRVPENGAGPCTIEDVWDDETISEDEVKELGLLEDSKCAEIDAFLLNRE